MPPSPHALQPVLQRPFYDFCDGLPGLFGKFPRQLFGFRVLNANRHVIRSLFEVHTALARPSFALGVYPGSCWGIPDDPSGLRCLHPGRSFGTSAVRLAFTPTILSRRSGWVCGAKNLSSFFPTFNLAE